MWALSGVGAGHCRHTHQARLITGKWIFQRSYTPAEGRSGFQVSVCCPCPSLVSSLTTLRSAGRSRSGGVLFSSEGLGQDASRRSAPHKQEFTCPATLSAWSRPLWPLFRRECRGATRRSARASLAQLDNAVLELMISSILALKQRLGISKGHLLDGLFQRVSCVGLL
jgi:hypothetical protein